MFLVIRICENNNRLLVCGTKKQQKQTTIYKQKQQRQPQQQQCRHIADHGAVDQVATLVSYDYKISYRNKSSSEMCPMEILFNYSGRNSNVELGNSDRSTGQAGKFLLFVLSNNFSTASHNSKPAQNNHPHTNTKHQHQHHHEFTTGSQVHLCHLESLDFWEESDLALVFIITKDGLGVSCSSS